MRILLIFPNLYATEKYVSVTIHPPLSLAYLGAVLERAKHEVKIIDAAAERYSIKKITEIISNYRPQLIGLTSNIANALICQLTAIKCKKLFPEVTLVIGGPWASTNEQHLIDRRIADIVVKGEAEITILELISALEHRSDLVKVPGIVFKNSHGETVTTATRPLIENLDELPFPAWHLLSKPSKYNYLHRGKRFYPILTSRGCPYQCIHCSKNIFGSRWRARSVENVIEEVKYLKKEFNIDEILIADDTFTQNQTRAFKILLKIARLPFRVKIQFSNGVRADLINDVLLDAMKYAGVYRIMLGIESGNQEIVTQIGKGLTLQKVEKLASSLKKRFYFTTVGNYMLGHPFDSIKTINETVNFSKKISFDYAFFYKNVVFPGTKQYQIINDDQRSKILVNSKKGLPRGYNFPAATFETPKLRKETLEKMWVQAYRQYYMRISKLFHLIIKVRGRGELIWILRNVVITILNYVGN